MFQEVRKGIYIPIRNAEASFSSQKTCLEILISQPFFVLHPSSPIHFPSQECR